jgi:hypothetical protein
MTRGKKTEEGRMQCACVEGLVFERLKLKTQLSGG